MATASSADVMPKFEGEEPIPDTPMAVLEGRVLDGGDWYKAKLGDEDAASSKEYRALPLVLGTYRFLYLVFG